MCVCHFILLVPYLLTSLVEHAYYSCVSKKFQLLSAVEETRDDCVICFDRMEDGDILLHVNHCNHRFHLDCMKEWNNKYNRTCPMCRESVGFIF